MSTFFPSQHDGKNTCALKSEQGSWGRYFVSLEDPSSLMHMWDIACWAGLESLYVLARVSIIPFHLFGYISPKKRIPSNHSQSIRWCNRNLMFRVASCRVLGIIAHSIHIIQLLTPLAHYTNPNLNLYDTYNPLNIHKLKPTLRLMIQLRNPIVTLIDLNTTCRPASFSSCILCHCSLECCSSCY